MLSQVENQTQQLRTRIARSRRRLDRRAQKLSMDARQLFSAGSLAKLVGNRSWLASLVVGVVIWRWLFGNRSPESRPQSLIGNAAFSWLHRLVRRLRVLAWQSRRSPTRASTESGHE